MTITNNQNIPLTQSSASGKQNLILPSFRETKKGKVDKCRNSSRRGFSLRWRHLWLTNFPGFVFPVIAVDWVINRSEATIAISWLVYARYRTVEISLATLVCVIYIYIQIIYIHTYGPNTPSHSATVGRPGFFGKDTSTGFRQGYRALTRSSWFLDSSDSWSSRQRLKIIESLSYSERHTFDGFIWVAILNHWIIRRHGPSAPAGPSAHARTFSPPYVRETFLPHWN